MIVNCKILPFVIMLDSFLNLSHTHTRTRTSSCPLLNLAVTPVICLHTPSFISHTPLSVMATSLKTMSSMKSAQPEEAAKMSADGWGGQTLTHAFSRAMSACALEQAPTTSVWARAGQERQPSSFDVRREEEVLGSTVGYNQIWDIKATASFHCIHSILQFLSFHISVFKLPTFVLFLLTFSLSCLFVLWRASSLASFNVSTTATQQRKHDRLEVRVSVEMILCPCKSRPDQSFCPGEMSAEDARSIPEDCLSSEEDKAQTFFFR